MNWESLDAFLAMGGHGWFVWGAYGFTALVMLLETWRSRSRLRKALRLAGEGSDGEADDFDEPARPGAQTLQPQASGQTPQASQTPPNTSQPPAGIRL